MLLVWEGQPGNVTRAWRVGEKAVLSCTISPDGSRVLTGSIEGLLAQWEVSTQRRLSLFLAHPRPVSCITYSPDGQRMATSSWDNTLMHWKAAGDGKGTSLVGHTDIVAGCRFTPDSRRLFSWSYDGSLRLWDVQWSRPVLEWQGHADRVLAGAVSPDGRWLASASRDGTIILWDSQGQEVARHVDTKAEFRACLFSNDGERLLTLSANGEILSHPVNAFDECVREETGVAIQCATLNSAGDGLILGTSNGELKAVQVAALVNRPCCVTPYETQVSRQRFLDRLFKVERMERVLNFICPKCGADQTVPPDRKQAKCKACGRGVLVNGFAFAERPTIPRKADPAHKSPRSSSFYPVAMGRPPGA
jgi:hypothetical protein